MKVFVDTSGFKAIIDKEDDFHEESILIWKQLKEKKAAVITSNYILDETFTLLRARCGLKTSFKFRQALEESAPVLNIYRVTIKDEKEAWKWFKKDWRNLSFTDCISFAMMKRLDIKKAVSFDKHFKRAGFQLV